jgi:hypothetical protein
LYLLPDIVASQNKIIDTSDFLFLEQLTKDVLESSRVYPGQKLPEPFGTNNTGGVLIRPGGMDTYPSFWIRDYAMSLETGFVNKAEQKHMLLLTASTQCDQTWITKSETAIVPLGAIADHIRVENGLPIYFPGTYDYDLQGSKEYQYGIFPPYCDQFYFIQMAHCYVKNSSDLKILKKKINGVRLIDRLEMAFRVPPTRNNGQLVYTTELFVGVDFGFRDAIQITGDLCFPSILKYRAATELSELFARLKEKDKAGMYSAIASDIKEKLSKTFLDENGMLRASTGQSAQADVWSTALAVYLGLLPEEDQLKACRHLSYAYKNGNLAYKGNIRHIIMGEDFSEATAWEKSKVQKNTYQNGAYWGTPIGWVAFAISKVDSGLAEQLVKEYINDLRENDYRKGGPYHAPYECIFSTSYMRGPVYLTTVSCPYIVFKSLLKFRK